MNALRLYWPDWAGIIAALLVALVIGLVFLALQPTPDIQPGREMLRALLITETLFALPLWLVLRVIDFMLDGPTRRRP
ncbi:MAG: hypothetical protein AB7F35_28295 [Acetobacteraceae bacterium]